MKFDLPENNRFVFNLRNRVMWQDVLSLQAFGIQANLTEATGDMLLDLIGEIVERHQLPVIPLHKSWKRLSVSVGRKLVPTASVRPATAPSFILVVLIFLINQVRVTEQDLPAQFFGKTDLKGRPLQPISMVHMDIRERLAEALLYEVDPKEFQAKPIITMTTVGDETTRVYSSFASGKYFEALSKRIREINKEGIALCLTFGIDETTLNTTRSRTSSPLIMFIANTIGKSYKPIFLGYAPLKMPYSDEILHELLIHRDCGFADHRNWIIDTTKRQAILSFIEMVIKPLYQYEDCGVTIKVGMGDKQLEYTAFIHASGFMIDTKQAGELLGTSHNSKYCKCRICMEMHMSRFSSLSAVRILTYKIHSSCYNFI
jgi:hypothetical protein